MPPSESRSLLKFAFYDLCSCSCLFQCCFILAFPCLKGILFCKTPAHLVPNQS
ncbi:hypothetical protein Droror1_Dr00012254 [Drosera rotundifolia]